MAGVLPVVGSVFEGGRLAFTTFDEGYKSAQEHSLSMLRRVVSTGFGIVKKIFSARPIEWSEKKLQYLTRRCWNVMTSPKRVGEQMLLWGDKANATAWKLLHPLRKARPSIPPCSEKEAGEFMLQSKQTQQLALEKILISQEWQLTPDEVIEFQAAIDSDDSSLPAKLHDLTSKERETLSDLYSIYLYVSKKEREKSQIQVSDTEVDDFIRKSKEVQDTLLLLVSMYQSKRESSTKFGRALQNLQDHKEYSREIIKELVLESKKLPEDAYERTVLPDNFSQMALSLKVWCTRLVKKYAEVDGNDNQDLERLLEDLQAGKEGNRGDILVLLGYFNRMSIENRYALYDLSSSDILKLPEEQRLTFLAEVRNLLPAPITKKFIETIQGENSSKASRLVRQEFALLEKFWENPTSFATDKKSLKILIRTLNRQFPLYQKILFRQAFDNPMSVYFLTQEELEKNISDLEERLHDKKLGELDKEALQQSLGLFKAAYAAKNSDQELAIEKMEPTQSTNVPLSPLQQIDAKIGAHVVSEGFYSTSGHVVGATCQHLGRIGGLLVGLVPKIFGMMLSSSTGQVVVYGGVRLLATITQFLASFKMAQGIALQWVESKTKEMGFSWIDDVEAQVAKIPRFGLRAMSTLQETFASGVDAVKQRFDAFSSKLGELKEARDRIDSNGTPEEIQGRINAGRRSAKNAARGIHRFAEQNSHSSEHAGSTHLEDLARLSSQRVEEIFSNAPDVNEGIVQLGKAASSTIPEYRTIYVAAPDGKVFATKQKIEQPNCIWQWVSSWSQPQFAESILQTPQLADRLERLHKRGAEVQDLLGELSKAQHAQSQLQNAGWFMQLLATSSATSPIHSVYNRVLRPAFDGAMNVWQEEVTMLQKFLQFSEGIEDLQQSTARGALKLGMEAGEAAQQAANQLQHHTTWLADMVAGSVEASRKEEKVTKMKGIVDATISLGAKATIAYLIGGLATASPVVALPFFLNRALPDLLAASAEPLSTGAGKALEGFFNISTASGKALGSGGNIMSCAILDKVQAHINVAMGTVDPKRVDNFRTLSFDDQKNVYELVIERGSISDELKKEITILGGRFFSPPQPPMSDEEQTLFIKLLLASYDALSPEVFINISNTYYASLSPAIRHRIIHIVKKENPSITIEGISHLVKLFNSLPDEKRKKIHEMIIEEYMALSRDQKKEFCFQVLHSKAFSASGKPTADLLIKSSDPDAPPFSAKEAKPLFKLHQQVTKEEFNDVSPKHMVQNSRARQVRAYEVLEKYAPSLLETLGNYLHLKKEHIRAALLRGQAIDIQLHQQIRRFTAGMASLLRQLHDKEREEWQEASQVEIETMTPDEALIYLEFILQHCPATKENIVLMTATIQKDRSAKKCAKQFVELFNALTPEQKKEVRLIAQQQSHAISNILTSCRQEIADLDASMHKLDQKRSVIQREIAALKALVQSYTELGQDSSTVHNISVLKSEIEKKNIALNAIEQRIALGMDQRQQLASLLIEEREEVPLAPNIQGIEKTDSVSLSLSELLFRSLAQELEKATSLDDLEVKYISVNESLASLQQHVPNGKEASSKRLQHYFAEGTQSLTEVYERRKDFFVKAQEEAVMMEDHTDNHQDSSAHHEDAKDSLPKIIAMLPRSMAEDYKKKRQAGIKSMKIGQGNGAKTPSKTWKVFSRLSSWTQRLVHG